MIAEFVDELASHERGLNVLRDLRGLLTNGALGLDSKGKRALRNLLDLALSSFPQSVVDEINSALEANDVRSENVDG